MNSATNSDEIPPTHESCHCERCDEGVAIREHLTDAQNYCLRCRRSFVNAQAFREHIQHSSAHREDPLAVPGHSQWQFDRGRPYCLECRKVYRDDNGLHDHYRQSKRHEYCEQCRRLFANTNELVSHLQSSDHVPPKIPCPMHVSNCRQWFVDGPSLIAHIDSGCLPGMPREFLDRWVREYPRNRPAPPFVPAANDEEPDTGGAARHIATQEAFNGWKYECYLCHGTFRLLSALNNHLRQSPLHKEDRGFTCSGTVCTRSFPTLASLWAHVESETCGVVRFKISGTAARDDWRARE
ncbi:hypothetical protein C8F01DRAFT_1019202 [Mycena amicta]|nr:hypothetical protein C8F01DRAFT_1019202 [Mycena amicta]